LKDTTMATLRWYFDFVSPYSYLHWQKLKQLPEFPRIQPVPIAFGAVLHHLGNLGPAEIPAKRRFIYRQLLWTAQAEGTPLRFPPGHPFNPLSALRLCLAAGGSAQAVDVLFDWIWRDGNAADSAEALREPAARLGIEDVASAIATPRSRSSCGGTPRPPLQPACSACRPWPSMANCSGATTPTR
jgi:2-hydroxychromene-2-carboxylate isomerase